MRADITFDEALSLVTNVPTLIARGILSPAADAMGADAIVIQYADANALTEREAYAELMGQES